ncbi:MAG: hypothetical protein PW734_06665 [Verrucomicrobium sp.]|nr:hypothetical protein [Verrucomicrobium sp.]
MRVGSKVICVDDSDTLGLRQFYLHWPVKGHVYVVRNVVMGMSPRTTIDQAREGQIEVTIYLMGFHNPLSNKPPHPERGYNAERFRELEPPKEEAIEKEEFAELEI